MSTKNLYYKGADFKNGVLDEGDVDERGISPALWNYREPHKFPKAEFTSGSEFFMKKLDQNPDDLCVKYRKLISRDLVATDPSQPDKKYEKLKFAEEYTCFTRREYKERILNFAKGLQKVHNFKPQDRVVIYAETQMDWMVTLAACWCLNLTVVTVYATLGAEGASYGIRQTHAPVVVCDAKLGKNMAKILESCPEVKKVVTFGEVVIDGADTVTFDQILKEGSEVEGELNVEVQAKPEDIAVIMYTSGTTGRPKGVMESHSNLVHQAIGGGLWFDEYQREPSEVYLAYLPLAHIMELVVESFFLSVGVVLAYGTPHTLTATGVKLAAGCTGDLELARPTVMAFAPAVLDKIYAAINLKMSSGLKKVILDWATESGRVNQEEGGNIGAHWIYSPVLKKIQALVGGRIKLGISGSAPLAPAIQRFMQTVLNIPIRQGYGLTETCAISCISDLGSNAVNCVGAPIPSTVIRLRDWKDGGYTFADKNNAAIGKPRGEILIGGPTVCMGYLEDDQDEEQAEQIRAKNAEEFIEVDGCRYFCTGDIGQINEDGQLQIVDRKKDLFKGANGEYVALSKVEAALKLSKYCDMPMVYGKTGECSVVAVICPSHPLLKSLGAEHGIEGTIAEIGANETIKKIVFDDLNAQCKKSGLLRFECPSAYAMVFNNEEPLEAAWTPVNGLLTDTFKLKRPIIYKTHEALIKSLYA